MLFVVWQGLAGAIFTLLGDGLLESKGDHRCHCAISLSDQSTLAPPKNTRKRVGGQQKALNELFLNFIHIELQKLWHVYVSSENTGDGLTPHFSIFKWAYSNSGSLRHGNASTHTLHSSVSLLDNILACVSYPPDSNTASMSAASLEMHISLLVEPVHDRPGSIDRTRLLIDSWAEWKPSKILFWRRCWDELSPDDSCSVKTVPGNSLIKLQRRTT